MNEEELYKLLNIPNKPWIELTDEEIQLFEKNNNYIKQLQQENIQQKEEIENLKQQLKDKDEKISKIIEYCNGSTFEVSTREYGMLNVINYEDVLEILESNKED